MTTETPAPETPESNEPNFTCARCGHKASSHAEQGYGPCATKTCAAAGKCEAFQFEPDAGRAPEEPQAEDGGDEPATSTTEIPPDDTGYDPTRPFDPSGHMRILEHKNRQGRVVARSHYLDVKWRIAWLRSPSGVVEGYMPAHPNWRIESTPLMDFSEMQERGFALFRARLYDTDDGTDINREGRLIAEAHGSEHIDDWRDFIEKAETKAIGRCLANAGYGTAQAAEFEEGERIADAGVGIRAPDSLPVPDCPRGHGSGPVRRMLGRFGTTKGQEIFWCGHKVGGKACGWTMTVADWRARVEGLKADDPGDPNAGAAEPEEGPPVGESRTASSASGAEPGGTASRATASAGTASAGEGSSATRPRPPDPDRPALDFGAIPKLLSQHQVQMPDVMRRWQMERPTPQEFERVMAAEGITLDALIAAAADPA